MYWTFLGNVLHTNTSHRIIPMRTASSNGMLALVAHQIRPDLIYLDASHANPDVFIDMENFYALLMPGGTMFIDDVTAVIPVKESFNSLCKRHGLVPKFIAKHNHSALACRQSLKKGSTRHD